MGLLVTFLFGRGGGRILSTDFESLILDKFYVIVLEVIAEILYSGVKR